MAVSDDGWLVANAALEDRAVGIDFCRLHCPAAGLAAFFAIYLPFFSGDAERKFVGNAIAALTRRLRAVEQ